MSAQIGLDATSNSGVQTNVSPVTWSHVCTGSNLVLFVRVHITDTTNSITAVTYNGVAMTLVKELAANNARASIYRLINPTTGSNTVSVTYSSSTINSFCSAISLTNVNQTTPVGDTETATLSTSPASLTLLTSKNNGWLLDALTIASTPSAVIGVGQTQEYNTTVSTYQIGASHKGPRPPSGAEIMQWTNTSIFAWVYVAIEVVPVGTSDISPTNSLRPAIFKPGIAR